VEVRDVAGQQHRALPLELHEQPVVARRMPGEIDHHHAPVAEHVVPVARRDPPDPIGWGCEHAAWAFPGSFLRSR
jgi:hypothetical protein